MDVKRVWVIYFEEKILPFELFILILSNAERANTVF